MTGRIVLPDGAPAAPEQSQMTLTTCPACGHQLIVPAPLAPVAGQAHMQACIGMRLAELIEVVKGLVARLPSA